MNKKDEDISYVQKSQETTANWKAIVSGISLVLFMIIMTFALNTTKNTPSDETVSSQTASENAVEIETEQDGVEIPEEDPYEDFVTIGTGTHVLTDEYGNDLYYYNIPEGWEYTEGGQLLSQYPDGMYLSISENNVADFSLSIPFADYSDRYGESFVIDVCHESPEVLCEEMFGDIPEAECYPSSYEDEHTAVYSVRLTNEAEDIENNTPAYYYHFIVMKKAENDPYSTLTFVVTSEDLDYVGDVDCDGLFGGDLMNFRYFVVNTLCQ